MISTMFKKMCVGKRLQGNTGKINCACFWAAAFFVLTFIFLE